MRFTGTKSAPDFVDVKTQKMFARRLPKYCYVSSQRNNLIKLSHYDEKKKLAHASQIVSA